MCMCGDLYCISCGPAQGNVRCFTCGEWSLDGGCKDPETCLQQERAFDAMLDRQANQEAYEETIDLEELIHNIVEG